MARTSKCIAGGTDGPHTLAPHSFQHGSHPSTFDIDSLFHLLLLLFSNILDADTCLTRKIYSSSHMKVSNTPKIEHQLKIIWGLLTLNSQTRLYSSQQMNGNIIRSLNGQNCVATSWAESPFFRFVSLMGCIDTISPIASFAFVKISWQADYLRDRRKWVACKQISSFFDISWT